MRGFLGGWACAGIALLCACWAAAEEWPRGSVHFEAPEDLAAHRIHNPGTDGTAVPTWAVGSCRIILIPAHGAANVSEAKRAQVETLMQQLGTADEDTLNAALQAFMRPSLVQIAEGRNLKEVSLSPDEPTFSAGNLLLARLDYVGEAPDGQRTRIRMFGVFAKALVHMTYIQVPEAESAACEQIAEGLLASYEAI